MGSENSKHQSGPGRAKPPTSPGMGAKRRSQFQKKSINTRRYSMSAIAPQIPPTVKLGSSVSCNDADEPLEDGGLQRSPSRLHSESKLSVNQPRSRSGSSVSNVSTAPSLNKSSRSPSVCSSLKTRQLIQSCFHNQFAESIGQRILKRTAEKRKDFGRFYTSLSINLREELAEAIKMLLKNSVASIDCNEELNRIAVEFGSSAVQFRALGFKADYFAVLADSTITECVFLDNAHHPAHQTLSAFSQFITTLFSSVRDGFYSEKHNEMRRTRRSNSSFMNHARANVVPARKSSDQQSKSSKSREASPISPTSLEYGDEFSSQESVEQTTCSSGGHDHEFSPMACSDPNSDEGLEFSTRLHFVEKFEKENTCWGAAVDAKNGLLMPPAPTI